MLKKIKKVAAKFQPRIKYVIDDADKITSPWRIFKIIGEFVNGFEFLKTYDAAATFFGSARTDKNEPIYKEATKLAKSLAELGFAIITGGGPGIMEAANKGAVEGKGISIGLNIQLPSEQRINKYVRQSQAFHYFFTRKVMLSYASEIYIYFPGGFGTMDELFEILTLVQTKKICGIPIILVGSDFWEPLTGWIDEVLNHKTKNISPEDTKLYNVVSDADEALKLINKLIKENKISTQEGPIEYSGKENIRKVKNGEHGGE